MTITYYGQPPERYEELETPRERDEQRARKNDIIGAQLAEKMVAVIGERGWCTGSMCITPSIVTRTETELADFTDLDPLRIQRLQLRLNLGAVCLEGAALVALDYKPNVENWDSQGHAWLMGNPEWKALWGWDTDGALEWNDAQSNPRPVVRWLETRAQMLYKRAETT